jgi:CRP/FNR family transcriptional regulator
MESVSPDVIQLLKDRGRKRRFSEDQEVFAGGDEALFLPIVISGRVKMIHFLEPGKEVIVGIFQTGEMFALPPVFDGGNYPATAIAMEETELLMLGRDDFLKLLRSSSDFAFAVIGWMADMLRDKTATIQNLATASPQHRVGHILLKLAEKEGRAAPAKITLRRQDIARMAGLTTETAIRAIRKLADRNLIEITHGKIYVHDSGPLSKYLEN